MASLYAIRTLFLPRPPFRLQHIFALELEEYQREGVSGAAVSYIDNSQVLVRPHNRPAME